jgi:hypothetical protein
MQPIGGAQSEREYQQAHRCQQQEKKPGAAHQRPASFSFGQPPPPTTTTGFIPSDETWATL